MEGQSQPVFEASDAFALSCPIPIQQYPHVLLAHGGGGRLMQQLIEGLFKPAFGQTEQVSHDAIALQLPAAKIALTTDSFVVNPLFFPGGDIGSLAIHGTVNDLAMAGARPLYLTVGFILEEGLPMVTLWRVVQSMAEAARAAKVQLVTGDTKVVERGKGDGIYINTAGVGVIEHEQAIDPSQVQVGDRILLSGDIGRHGIAIMAQREGLAFESPIESDSAPLADTVMALLAAGLEIHCLRDLTRGGLASALNEIAEAAGMTIRIEASKIATQEAVRGVCEILGLDPLYIANEGRFVAFVAPASAEQALAILQQQDPQAQIIGEVLSRGESLVFQRNTIGAERIIDLLSGEQLPRIC